MTEDFHTCNFSMEFWNDNENLISGGFVQKVVLNKISSRDSEEVELKKKERASGLAFVFCWKTTQLCYIAAVG